MSHHRRHLEKSENLTTLLGAIIMLVFWLSIATFPEFFFFNPTGNSDVLRRAELIFSTIGWILMSTAVPIVLYLYSHGRKKLLALLPYLAAIWPLSLSVAQLTTYIQTGSFYLEYLINFPIFIFTDIATPIIVMIIWFDLQDSKSKVSLNPRVNEASNAI
jgi:hypothetical protein